MTDEKLAEALNNAVDIGASWIRVDLSWADIQPSYADDYEWEQFDRIATQAHRRGLEVLPILTYTPEWARVSGVSRSPAPQRMSLSSRHSQARQRPDTLKEVTQLGNLE